MNIGNNLLDEIGNLIGPSASPLLDNFILIDSHFCYFLLVLVCLLNPFLCCIIHVFSNINALCFFVKQLLASLAVASISSSTVDKVPDFDKSDIVKIDAITPVCILGTELLKFISDVVMNSGRGWTEPSVMLH